MLKIVIVLSVILGILSVSFAVVNLGVLAIAIFVFKIGIWGAWIASLASQTVQAFMLWRYTKKLDAFKVES